MEHFEILDAQIKTPFTMIISGPPLAGKTTFLIGLLKEAHNLIDNPPNNIVWFYGEYNANIEYLEKTFKNIEVVKGIPENLTDYINPLKDNLFVFDDLLREASCDSKISDLFTRQSHHRNVSVVYVMQNLYFQGKERKTFLRCVHYLVLFNNPLDMSVVYATAQKIMPKRSSLFLKIYDIAANRQNGYLFIDGRQTTKPYLRFKTDILAGYQKVFSLE